MVIKNMRYAAGVFLTLFVIGCTQEPTPTPPPTTQYEDAVDYDNNDSQVGSLAGAAAVGAVTGYLVSNATNTSRNIPTNTTLNGRTTQPRYIETPKKVKTSSTKPIKVKSNKASSTKSKPRKVNLTKKSSSSKFRSSSSSSRRK